MVLRPRKVYFYRLLIAKGDEEPAPVPEDHLCELFGALKGFQPGDLLHRRNGRDLQGVVSDHVHSAYGYLYLGKIRPKSDLPDDLGSGVPESLAKNASVRLVSEPCYVVPTGIESTVAVLTTWSGAKAPDVADWLTRCADLTDPTDNYVLAPITTERQLEMLEEAQYVSRIEVQIAPGTADLERDPEGELENAISEMREVGGGEATLYFAASFGASLPDTVQGRKFTEEAKRFLENGKFKKAVANLKFPEDDRAHWRTEQVNFVQQLITHSVQISDEPDSPLEADRILAELQQAIRENAEYLRI